MERGPLAFLPPTAAPDAGGPVLPKPPLCSPAAHVRSGPLLRPGQGTSTGPARGTFPEPSRQVGPRPFHVSPAAGGSFPQLRTPWTQRGSAVNPVFRVQACFLTLLRET